MQFERMRRFPFMLFFGVLTLGCTLESPYFEVQDNCVTVNRRMWIQNLWIRTSNPSQSYRIARNMGYDGSHSICFDSIPPGYFLICQRDTLNLREIEFAEGDSVEIKQPGGDRGSYSKSYIFTNGRLTALN